MRTIQISESVFQQLAKQSENFENPSETIARVFKNYQEFLANKGRNTDKIKEVKAERKSILDMSFEEFYQAVQNDKIFNLTERLNVLESCNTFFTTHNSFANMPTKVRQAVGGTIKYLSDSNHDSSANFKIFCSMSGAGFYSGAMKQNNPYISEALQQIPLTGEVTKEMYDSFISLFLQAFPSSGAGYGGASRLLTVRRPDVFLSLNQANIYLLSQDFQVNVRDFAKYNKFEAYWNLVEKSHKTKWYLAEKPQDESRLKVWKNRCALTDVFYYNPKFQEE